MPIVIFITLLIQKTEEMKTISRKNEQNIIGYAIPETNNIILGMYGRDYLVTTSDGIMIYTRGEMKEIFNLDVENSDMERLGWTA